MGLTIGVDVGGSHVTSILFDNMVAREHSNITFPPRSKGADIVEIITEAVNAVWRKENPLPPVGIGIPGIITESGVLELAPNLGLRVFDMVRALNCAGLRAYILNDANAAALGEWHAGAGKGCNSIVCVTVGTGIGSGVVLHGRPLIGAYGRAGEIGHMTVMPGGPECSCGQRGCLEALSSATAIAREGRRLAQAGDEALNDLARGSGHETADISARMVFEAMRLGSKGARQAIETAARWLGMALSSVVVMLDPDVIVVGGGVGQAGEDFLGPVRSALSENVVCALRETPVVQAQLGASAGVTGAAVYAAQREAVLGR